jgi:hypothetical protein
MPLFTTNPLSKGASVSFWYDQARSIVTVTSTPGGDSLTLAQIRSLKSRLCQLLEDPKRPLSSQSGHSDESEMNIKAWHCQAIDKCRISCQTTQATLSKHQLAAFIDRLEAVIANAKESSSTHNTETINE